MDPSASSSTSQIEHRPVAKTHTLDSSVRHVYNCRAMLDYANRFHHDTNLAWEVQAINDQELLSNCTRVLAFAQRA